MFASTGSTSRPESISARRHKPVRIHDPVHVARPRRPAPRKIILRPAAHVVEGKRIVDRHVIKLHRRQIRLELPRLRVVPGLIHPAIRPQQPMLRIVRIDPDRVIVPVMIRLAHLLQSLAAIQRLAQLNIHHKNSVHIFRIGKPPARNTSRPDQTRSAAPKSRPYRSTGKFRPSHPPPQSSHTPHSDPPAKPPARSVPYPPSAIPISTCSKSRPRRSTYKSRSPARHRSK